MYVVLQCGLKTSSRKQIKLAVHKKSKDFPRFVIISEKSILEVGNRWLWSSKNGCFLGKKDPLQANFHKCFPKPHMRTRKHVFLCKFREIWPTGSRWNCVLFNGQKNNFNSPSLAPKICQGQLQTIYSEFPKFHPNPFTSGGVVAERMNIVQTRHKVFAILGEASASSPSNKKHVYKLSKSVQC